MLAVGEYDIHASEYGRGAYGRVVRATHRPTGETVACKVIGPFRRANENDGGKACHPGYAEVTAMRRLAERPHVNVIGYRDDVLLETEEGTTLHIFIYGHVLRIDVHTRAAPRAGCTHK